MKKVSCDLLALDFGNILSDSNVIMCTLLVKIIDYVLDRTSQSAILKPFTVRFKLFISLT